MQGDAERIAALAHSYTPPDPVKLQQAFKDGNAKLNPGTRSNQVQLLITTFLKPNDSMTVTFDKVAKAIYSVQVASYLDSPSDAVTLWCNLPSCRRESTICELL